CNIIALFGVNVGYIGAAGASSGTCLPELKLMVACTATRATEGVVAMNKPCTFSSSDLQFKGTPVEQAQCLLRQARVGGNVNDTPATLPNALSIRIGKPVEFNRSQLDAYLAFKGIAARDIGGALDGAVSSTPRGKKALYFVIHDTSDEISTVAFPPD